MSILENYIEYFKAGDAHRLASLFADDAVFYDDAAAKVGQPVAVEGRENIEAFYKRLFRHGGLKVSNIGINANAMRYDVEVWGMVILALGVVKEDDSLIKEYRVIAV